MSCVFTLNNEAFKSLAYYGSLLLGKTVVMSVITGFCRVSLKSYINPEDTVLSGPNTADKRKTFLRANGTVERIRRAHLNDLENILPFLAISMLYLTTNPEIASAVWRFKVFFWARLLHTVFYLGKFPQPSRALVFNAGLLVTIDMIARTFLSAI